MRPRPAAPVNAPSPLKTTGASSGHCRAVASSTKSLTASTAAGSTAASRQSSVPARTDSAATITFQRGAAAALPRAATEAALAARSALAALAALVGLGNATTGAAAPLAD